MLLDSLVVVPKKVIDIFFTFFPIYFCYAFHFCVVCFDSTHLTMETKMQPLLFLMLLLLLFFF